MSLPRKRTLFSTLATALLVLLFGSACAQRPAAQQAATSAPAASIPERYVDTSAFKQDGPYTFCFSDASASSSWRLAMVEHVRYEVRHHEAIATFHETDANDDPAKQISDIEGLLAKGCDVLLVSPAKLDELKPPIDK